MINEIAVNLATVFVKLLVAANTTLPVKKGIKIILAFNKQLLSQIHVMHWVDNPDLSNSKCLTVFPYPPKSLHSLHLSFLFSTVLHELFFQNTNFVFPLLSWVYPVTQLERIRLQCGRSGLSSWVGKTPWRREPTPVFWPGEFHGLYSPWGHKESDITERISLSLSLLLYILWSLLSYTLWCTHYISKCVNRLTSNAFLFFQVQLETWFKLQFKLSLL